jgi:alkylhydroperoxidase/carboxymuconolactone decarboxylase family protein YurZ
VASKRYPETAFYEFETNYDAAVELIRRVFGEERAAAVGAAKGKSQRTDFMTAMTWGWFFHRPGLPLTDRVLCVLGALTPKGLEAELRDHIQLGLAMGLDREKVREALFITSVYGGIPTARWALDVCDSLCAELDARGWQPYLPPAPLHDRKLYDYHDFAVNYPSGIDMTIWLYGPRGTTREERLSHMGESSIGDMQAIHWGWLNQRPILTPRERCLFMLGIDSATHGFLALKDHTGWALKAGITPAEVREAMTMLYLFNGWPSNREAFVVVNARLDELAAEAGNPASDGAARP